MGLAQARPNELCYHFNKWCIKVLTGTGISVKVLIFVSGIASPTQTIVGVAMRDLLSELQELTNWFYFGVCVGVHQATLKEIRQDYEDTEECKREMLAVWRNKEIATWSKVIRALAEVGMPRLALEIASKYGMHREHKIILPRELV